MKNGVQTFATRSGERARLWRTPAQNTSTVAEPSPAHTAARGGRSPSFRSRFERAHLHAAEPPWRGEARATDLEFGNNTR